MKHNIYQMNGALLIANRYIDYINSKVGYMRYTGDKRSYYGVDKEKMAIGFTPTRS